MLGEKRCYAVMPYGGEDEEKQKLYMLIYQLYIRIPAEDMGYMVEREDLSDDGGNIFTNVIEHLAEDDLVIADISGINWNVAYELGIRHSLVKGKTILLCDKEQQDKKFDAFGLKVIFYRSKDIQIEFIEIQNRIKERIRSREQRVKADNDIHIRYPILPQFVCRDAIGREKSQLDKDEMEKKKLERNK